MVTTVIETVASWRTIYIAFFVSRVQVTLGRVQKTATQAVCGCTWTSSTVTIAERACLRGVRELVTGTASASVCSINEVSRCTTAARSVSWCWTRATRGSTGIASKVCIVSVSPWRTTNDASLYWEVKLCWRNLFTLSTLNCKQIEWAKGAPCGTRGAKERAIRTYCIACVGTNRITRVVWRVKIWLSTVYQSTWSTSIQRRACKAVWITSLAFRSCTIKKLSNRALSCAISCTKH